MNKELQPLLRSKVVAAASRLGRMREAVAAAMHDKSEIATQLDTPTLKADFDLALIDRNLPLRHYLATVF